MGNIIKPFDLPPATETEAGIALLASQAEVDAGTDDTRIVTPAKLNNFTKITPIFSPPSSIHGILKVLKLYNNGVNLWDSTTHYTLSGMTSGVTLDCLVDTINVGYEIRGFGGMYHEIVTNYTDNNRISYMNSGIIRVIDGRYIYGGDEQTYFQVQPNPNGITGTVDIGSISSGYSSDKYVTIFLNLIITPYYNSTLNDYILTATYSLGAISAIRTQATYGLTPNWGTIINFQIRINKS